MKRLWSFFVSARRNGKRLIALCYAVFFAVSSLVVLFGIVEEGVRRMTGDVQVIEFSANLEDVFRLEELEWDGMYYIALGVDPQMELDLSQVAPDGSAMYIRSITLYMEDLNMDPGEVTAFYKPDPDMVDYDADYRVWAHRDAQNVYSFALPLSKMYGIRIDPGIFGGLRFRLERVVLNEPRSPLERLTPTRPYLLALAVAPLLAASVLHWMFCAWDLPAKKRQEKKRRDSGGTTTQGSS